MDAALSKMIAEATRLVAWLGEDPARGTLREMASEMASTLESGGRILSCGNGGSMCDAMHFAEEMSGRFRDDRPALSALAISDPGHLSCVANDYGYDAVFARGVEAHGRAGDVLLAITTSGNSPNVLAAAAAAHACGMRVHALLGKGGGALASTADRALVVPSDLTDRIQEVHIKAVHLLIESVERHLFPENYAD